MTTHAIRAGLGRDFWLFRTGQALSIVGDSCGAIALAWWILDATGSAIIMSSVLAPAMFVRIFLTPLLGPLGDRVARKRLIATSDLWRGALTLLLAMLAYEGRFALSSVIALYVLIAIGGALYGPASTSIVPQLVSSEHVHPAFQQTQAIASAGAIVGGFVGGALVSGLGIPGAFLVDASSFFIGAVTAQMIRADTRPAAKADSCENGSARESAISRWRHDLAGGFQFLYVVRLLFVLALVAMLLNFVLAPLSVVVPIFVKQARGLPAWYLGALRSSLGGGAIAGAALTGRLGRYLAIDRVIALGIALMGVAIATLPWAPGLVWPMVALSAIGAGSSLANIPMMSQMTIATPDAFRTRVHAIMLFLGQGAAPVSVAFAGVFVVAFGLARTMAVMGIVALVLAPTLFLIPYFSSFFRRAPGEAGAYLKALYPRAFARGSEAPGDLTPSN